MKNKAQGGAAAVEFALVFPIFLVLVFAIIEFGAVFYNKTFITNASREAARAGVVLKTPKLTTDEVVGIARKYCGQSQDASTKEWSIVPLNLLGFDSSNALDVSATGAGDTFGTPLTVTVSYKYNWLVLGPLIGFVAGPITLSATTVMNNE